MYRSLITLLVLFASISSIGSQQCKTEWIDYKIDGGHVLLGDYENLNEPIKTLHLNKEYKVAFRMKWSNITRSSSSNLLTWYTKLDDEVVASGDFNLSTTWYLPNYIETGKG